MTSQSSYNERRQSVKFCATTAEPPPIPLTTPASSIVGKIFVQEDEAVVLKNLHCWHIYSKAFTGSFSSSHIYQGTVASDFTHVLVGVKSESTYVVAALDDINVAFKGTTSRFRAQRVNPRSPVYWYNLRNVFGFSPTSRIYLGLCSNQTWDLYGYINSTLGDCDKRLSWAVYSHRSTFHYCFSDAEPHSSRRVESVQEELECNRERRNVDEELGSSGLFSLADTTSREISSTAIGVSVVNPIVLLR